MAFEHFRGWLQLTEDWFASPLGAFVDQAEQTGADLGHLPRQDKVNAMLEVGAGHGAIARLLTQYAQQVVRG